MTSTALSQLPNYRAWLIYSIPSLRWLDFNKVKQSERDNAKKLFINEEDDTLTTLAKSMGAQAVSAEQAINGSKGAKTFEVEDNSTNKGLTDEQKMRIRKAIEKAGTLEEIQRLKRMLADGFVPDDRTLKALGGK